MLDFKVREEISEVITALHRFIDIEIKPLQKKFQKELENERYFYDERRFGKERKGSALGVERHLAPR